MKFLSALAVLAAAASVQAKIKQPNACTKICSSFLASFQTDLGCDNSEDFDYACSCQSEIYTDSFALCVKTCYDDERVSAWKTWVKKCTKAGYAYSEGWDYYYEEGLSDYVSAANINKTTVVDKPVLPKYATVHNNYLARFQKNRTMVWAEYYGNIINSLWALLILISFLRLVSVRLSPRKGSAPYGFVTKFRKIFILPATFGKRHIQSVKGLGTVPLRWQALVVFLLFCMIIIFSFVDIHMTPLPNTYYSHALQWGRYIGDRTAILGIIQLPVLFLFGGRNNILMLLTGWSFETFNVFHKWLGRFTFLAICFHAWAFSYYYGNVGGQNGTGKWEYYKEEILQTKENYLGIVAIVMMGLIMIGAAYPLRHRWYEVFLVFHISLAICFFAVAWHHVKEHGYMNYFYAATAVWAFDVLLRALRVATAGPFTKAQITAHGDAIYIAVKPSLRWSAKPGQYAFIYVLRHNFWESHPFSIVETRDGHYIFVAKKHKGLTHKLHTSVSKTDNKTDIARVWIEGPYGDTFPVARYETVLLIAGGIGITAMLSYALDMKRKGTDQHVVLYWMVRESSSLKWVKEQLAELTESGLIEINIFVTGESEGEKTAAAGDESSTSLSDASASDKEGRAISGPRYSVKFNARPEIREVIASTVKSAEGSVAVVSCGPDTLADECRSATTENLDQGKGRVDYFEDAFSWA
ncbi:ferric reductase NAD binding domain-containing protein [Myxozyma melibiosi]|uniref:ferric-chelate reductase (NADPH) n=1 Tax=Myxozyma melibiosi TaxID=54550 RepID=A0ABR1F2F0_9ASCO